MRRKQEVVCNNCGAKLSPGTKFCSEMRNKGRVIEFLQKNGQKIMVKIATGILTSKIICDRIFRKLNIVVCRFVHILCRLKGKQVRFLHGPAAVMGRLFRLLPLGDWKA